MDTLPSRYQVKRRLRFALLDVPALVVCGVGTLLLMVPFGPVAVLVHLCIVAILALMRGVTTGMLLSDNAFYAQALADGRREEAAAGFEALCARARPLRPKQHAVFVFHRGRVCLERGELDRADALFRAALASGWLGPADPMYPHLLESLAFVEGLRGDLGAARRYLERARDGQTGSVSLHGLLIDMVLAARAGRFAHVLELADRARGRTELHGTSLRTCAALCEAFARSRCLASGYRVTVERPVETLLATVRQAPSSQYACMVAGWPQMRAFAAEQIS